jgi:hypothetical protein
VIKEAKRLEYNKQVINSANKMKTTWNIIKTETNKAYGCSFFKYHNSPEAFNKYFLPVTEDIIHDIKKNVNNTEDPEYYMSKLSQNSFPSIKLRNTSYVDLAHAVYCKPFLGVYSQFFFCYLWNC